MLGQNYPTGWVRVLGCVLYVESFTDTQYLACTKSKQVTFSKYHVVAEVGIMALVKRKDIAD